MFGARGTRVPERDPLAGPAEGLDWAVLPPWRRGRRLLTSLGALGGSVSFLVDELGRREGEDRSPGSRSPIGLRMPHPDDRIVIASGGRDIPCPGSANARLPLSSGKQKAAEERDWLAQTANERAAAAQAH